MDYREEAEVQNIKQRFGIIGVSPKINHAIRTAIQVAPTDMSVLISGESGVLYCSIVVELRGSEDCNGVLHQIATSRQMATEHHDHDIDVEGCNDFYSGKGDKATVSRKM